MSARYVLGPERPCGDGYYREVVGSVVTEGGCATYFLSCRNIKDRVPRYEATYCDAGGDLQRAGLQRSYPSGTRWVTLTDKPASLTRARRAVREHFESTYGELNKKEGTK